MDEEIKNDEVSLKDIGNSIKVAMQMSSALTNGLEVIGKLIQEAQDTGNKRPNKPINERLVDTTGKKLHDGDIIYIFNGLQSKKKWSVERVEDISGKLFSRFDKYLGPVYTPLETTPPNWIMIIRSEESPGVLEMNIFHTDQIQYNFKEPNNGR